MKMFLGVKCEIAIVEETNRCIERLIKRYERGVIKPQHYADTLFFCVEALDYKWCKKFNNNLEMIIGFIMDELKKDIYNKKYQYFALDGMFTGGGLISYSISILQKKRQNVKGFSMFCNHVLCSYAKNFLNAVKERPLFFGYYDLIQGAAGILNYLLSQADEIDEVIISEIAEYLISLTKEKKYKGKEVIGFHIQSEQQSSNEEKRTMHEGNINFGLAHGMIGVLIVLTKYKDAGFYAKDIGIAINKLLNMYIKFTFMHNDILKFPTQLPLESYISGENEKWSFNSGWCYGNIGIVNGLMRCSRYLADIENYHYYENALLNIVNQPSEKYNLDIPIICHGYASIIAIQVGAYKETGNSKFMKTLERNIRKVLDTHQKYQKVNPHYLEDYSILQGAGGVVLTLMDALVYSLEYKEILMIS